MHPRPKLFLLDAFALIFRAYYAFMKAPRITSTGKNTNAQFGFTNTLLDILHKEKPTHIAVAFDTAAPTERHVLFDTYKAGRQETPEDIIAAVPDIKKILRGFRIPILELDGYEADDIIGTIATKAQALGFDVFMVSPDKDYGQIVQEHIFLYKPAYQKNDRQILGEKEICATWDIANTKQVIDMLALMGDAVDNIPGIPGIGEKTASKLLKEYHNLEGVLSQASLLKGSLGQKIQKGAQSALLSKKLATLNLEVPILFEEESCQIQDVEKDTLQAVFDALEFKTLTKRVLGNDLKPDTVDLFSETKIDIDSPLTESTFRTIENTPHEYLLCTTKEEIQQIVQELSPYNEICIDTETTGLDTMSAALVGLSLCAKPHRAFYIHFSAEKQEEVQMLLLLQPLFENEKIMWIGQNIKYDMAILLRYGITFKGKVFDTMLVQYLLDAESKKGMDFLSKKFLGYEPIPIERLLGEKGKKQKKMNEINPNLLKDYAAEDADVTLQLYRHFLKEQVLDARSASVLYNIEFPLIKVLLAVEQNGVKIDMVFLSELSARLEKELREIESQIFVLAGKVFNIASPKQLGEVLFEELRLQEDTKLVKTKTGQYATDDDVLEKLFEKHPIIPLTMQFRELSKLKSTYVDALPLLVNTQTQRIHTTFNQARAVTGRLSSLNPNLQNIPIRTELGKQMRRAFVANDDEHLFLSADYSQIELRIMAALSGDQNMIAAFKQDKDIHIATAASIYKVPESEVSSEMRYKAKSVNFGIIYGQGAWGLSQNIKVSRLEAKELIESYFKEYPQIKAYMDEQIRFAKQHGFVETLLGRRRWLRDIHSANATVRGFAERGAINMPIQGTAADMIKLAMIHIQQAIEEKGLRTKMILQVHDELLFEVPLEEKSTLEEIVSTLMPLAMKLPHAVHAKIEIGFGRNWLEAH